MSSQLCVYVKRRPGHLSYPGERDMCNSTIRGRYVSMPGHLDKTGDEIAAYTDDKLMINFARHFCARRRQPRQPGVPVGIFNLGRLEPARVPRHQGRAHRRRSYGRQQL